MKYAFGVDIGGTSVKMGLFEEDGNLLETWEVPTRTENGGANVLPDVAQSINNKISEKSLAKADILGVGMGVPGPVLDDGTVNRCVNLGWGVVNATEKVTELTGLPCKAGNDANVAALGEMWKGGGKGFKSLVVVTLGTGVGGGVILNGKMVSGFNGAAGEIGHMAVADPDEEVGICGCGKMGCLEQYASANGIAKSGKIYLKHHNDETTLRNFENLTSKDIFDEAAKGDKVALIIVENFGRTLGRALANVSCVVDVEAFVIGGGVSKAGTMVTDVVSKYYKEFAFHACRDAKFALATLGNNAGIYGGAYLVLN